MIKKDLFRKVQAKHLRFVFAIVFASLSLSGCASLILGSSETPPRYTLAPVPAGSSDAEQLPVRLVIADPNAEAAFETSKIAKSPESLRYEYFADGEWSDRAPNLLRIFLARSFENSGQVEAVGDRVSLPIGDFILDTDIRRFHVETRNGSSIARVSYSARLSDRRNKSIASRVFEADAPVDGASLMSAVQALNSAANQAGEDTISWALVEIERELLALAENE